MPEPRARESAKVELSAIPLDAPIPTAGAFYLWYPPDGAWISWDTYVNVAIFGANAERRRERAPQGSLF